MCYNCYNTYIFVIGIRTWGGWRMTGMVWKRWVLLEGGWRLSLQPVVTVE